TPQCVMGQPQDMPRGLPIKISPFLISSSRVIIGLWGRIVSLGPGSPGKVSRRKSYSRPSESFHFASSFITDEAHSAHELLTGASLAVMVRMDLLCMHLLRSSGLSFSICANCSHVLAPHSPQSRPGRVWVISSTLSMLISLA